MELAAHVLDVFLMDVIEIVRGIEQDQGYAQVVG
jgi:hypothetical protein